MEEFLLNRHDNHDTVLKRAHWRKRICQTNWAGKFLNAASDPMGWELKILQPGAGILSWLHVDQANFTISHWALIETLLWGTNCSGTQEVSQCRGLTWFWRIVFQQMALGDQKPLSLMKSKDEEQPLSHLLQHNCFLRLGHPLPPRSGWEVSSDGRKPSLCCCCGFAAKPLLCDLRLRDPPL